MAELKLNKGIQFRPRRCLLYGVHGWGKSTWASKFPNHVFLNFEDGLHDIDCVSTEQIKELYQLQTILQSLISMKEPLDWLVIDTLDWLEQIIHKQVAVDADKESIADIGYGKGPKIALTKWRRMLDTLEQLRAIKGTGIIALAHGTVKTINPPDLDSYDRYQPALHESASDLWMEWTDEVFFAGYKTDVIQKDMGFNRERGVAVGGQRYIRTNESPAILAKRRLELDDELFDTSWQTYQDAINKTKPTTKKDTKNG
jgi:hypothetical protein